MDWMSVTNLNAYVKGLKQKTTWELKQQKGDVTAKGTTLEDWLDSSQSKIWKEKAETPGEHRDEKLAAIQAKIEVGGKLTQKERDYLREKDPQAYQELITEERAQKAYEQALRRCRTQEEVRRLQTNSIHRSLMVVQSIEHNPHISQQKKLEIAMREKRMTDSVRKSTQEFVRRGDFAQLPTQEEMTQARHEWLDFPHLLKKPEEAEKLSFQEAEPSFPPPTRQESGASMEALDHQKIPRAYTESTSDTPREKTWNKKA